MSLNFYSEEEDNSKEESVNNYIDLFYEYKTKLPSLSEALNQMFKSKKIDNIKVNELTNDILDKCNTKINQNFEAIKNKYNKITKEDAYIICSYTCESKDENFSPYRLLNQSLVSDNRKNGIKNISKYLYIFLKSLRKLPIYYPDKENNHLYRCIRQKVNLSKDPFNDKLIPYIVGNKKTFWGFTSTSSNPKISYQFLDTTKQMKSGTLFTLEGDLWGYDITLFNWFGEKEILLEPERKFIVHNVLPALNEIIIVTCTILKSPIILDNNEIKNLIKNEEYKNNDDKIDYINYIKNNQKYIDIELFKKSENNIILFGNVNSGKSTIMEKLSNSKIHQYYYKRDDSLYTTLNDNIIIEFPGLHPDYNWNRHLKTQISLLSVIPVKIICLTIKYAIRYEFLIRDASEILKIFQENINNIIIIITFSEWLDNKKKCEIKKILQTKIKIKIPDDNIIFCSDREELLKNIINVKSHVQNIKSIKFSVKNLIKTVGEEGELFENLEFKGQYENEYNNEIEKFKKEFNNAKDNPSKLELYKKFKNYSDSLVDKYFSRCIGKLNDTEYSIIETIIFYNWSSGKLEKIIQNFQKDIRIESYNSEKILKLLFNN